MKLQSKLLLTIFILVVPCFANARELAPEVEYAMGYGAEAKICLKVCDEAESFAAGANVTGGVADNYDYQSQTPNGWPRTNGAWRHSDLTDVAYFYVWKLFEKIRKVE